MATANDTFTDTAATALVSHTPDSGGSWTLAPSQTTGLVISGSGTEVNSGNGDLNGYYHSITPATAEYDVTVVTTTQGAGGVSIGVTGRQDTAADTFYWFFWNGGAPGWQLRQHVAGVNTTHVSNNTLSPESVGRTIVMQLRSDRIVCTVDGTTVVDFGPGRTTNGTIDITAVGRPGIKGGDGTGSKATSWDFADAAGAQHDPFVKVLFKAA